MLWTPLLVVNTVEGVHLLSLHRYNLVVADQQAVESFMDGRD
ncbi:unnamed protein product [Urochloa humidicola]